VTLNAQIAQAAASEILTGKRVGKRETSVMRFGQSPQSVDLQVGLSNEDKVS
jgi:hypothetical protein